MNAATLSRIMIFTEPEHVADTVAVLAALTETRPTTVPMRRRDRITMDRYEIISGGINIQVMGGDPAVPALIEFHVPGAVELAAAIERVSAVGYTAEPWPVGDPDPAHALIRVGELEINVQRAPR
ncbi:hypothetical protein [Mycobacterium sp. 155]|uniref:hypothetical protein n=1 Tax=Mycobacterium sp. 155 TaxID=1157943 RepID=UPI0003609912|nr:hypothetical protein [Mycobacterium sp. 155]